MIITPILYENFKKTPEIKILKGVKEIHFGEIAYNFSETAVNHYTKPVTFVVHNIGAGKLEIRNISLASGDLEHFLINTTETTMLLNSENFTTFSVIFRPLSIGTKTVTIKIASNDPDEEEILFNVIGVAVASFGPKNVDAFAENEKVTISWSSVKGAISYNLYWSNQADVTKESGVKIENVSSPYVHTDLVNNMTYYYVVTVVNEYGEGLESDKVSARPGVTYYVDFTNGNDSNTGMSPEDAWKTLDKVNSFSFKPGEYILFKRGGIWRGRLKPITSGIKGLPITFGAYGNKEKPIITGRSSVSGWNYTTNWTQYSEDVWFIYYGPYKIAGRVWLSGVEYVKAEILADVNETYRWYFDLSTSRLYVYAPTNPAQYYTNIEESMAGTDSTAIILGKEYITLKNLDIRGGRYSIEILGSDYVVIEDCNVGLDAGHIGFWISRLESVRNTSNYGIIRRCKIDSGYRLTYYYEKAQTEDGIHLRDNANFWRIYENEIIDWGHNGIGLAQFAEDTTVSYNEIFSNNITAEHISYGRGFGTTGRTGGCQYNRFYYNIVKNTRAPNQIGGDHNYVYYNIIDTVKNSKVKGRDYGNGQGIVLTTSMSGHPEYVADYNKIYNNLIINCDEAGIQIEDWHEDYSIRFNEVKNNLIFNCGANSVQERENVGLVIGDYYDPTHEITGRDNVIQNNLIYSKGALNVVFYRGDLITVEELNNRTGSYNDTISNNIQLDPKFVDEMGGNYHLQYLSPAIDAGIFVGLTRDFDGVLVPQGTLVDIGVYEYH